MRVLKQLLGRIVAVDESQHGSGWAAMFRAVLQRSVVRASLWTFAGYGVAQAMRLVSNLILTRLLFPEAFGLMALVNTLITGLSLFATTGMRPFILHHEHGEESTYLRTAWTISIVRGILLFLAACAIAWPAVSFYGHPELSYLIPCVGLSAVFGGFSSTSVFVSQRRLQLSRVVTYELAGQVAGIVFMILLALSWKSVLSLALGTVGGSALSMVLSHVLFRHCGMRLEFNRTVGREMFKFGRWLFISTALTFLASNADKIVLGRYISSDMLGMYSIALMLATVIPVATETLAAKVLLPAYIKYMRLGRQAMQHRVFRVRLTLLAVTLPPTYVLILFGPWIVRLLYDSRYWGAGWMLQWLAIGGAFSVVGNTVGPILLAAGNSFGQAVYMAANFAIVSLSLGIGGYYGGSEGVICGQAVSMVIRLVPLLIIAKKYGALFWRIDVYAVGATVVISLLAAFAH